jgi:hypothetical protein
MTRKEFKQAVFERDGGKCVVCGAPAVDAHHLMERRLWSDGGYHLENGVALCAAHHLDAERTLLSPRELRELAGIAKVILPEHLDADEEYDKWGNIYLPGGLRAPGELFDDPSVQKVIEGEFSHHIKHPRTYHLPWSPGARQNKQDRVMEDTPWKDEDLIVVTEKLDGEGTTMYRDHIHARSLDSGYHPSRTWVKNLHGKIAHEIPEGWRVCGENVFAEHSIHYTDLPTYFFVHSIWNEKNECLSWDDTVEWSALLGLSTVPLLFSPTPWKDFDLFDVVVGDPHFADEAEGYVIRSCDSFHYRDFRKNVAKWVRQDHVQPNIHNWMAKEVVANDLA